MGRRPQTSCYPHHPGPGTPLWGSACVRPWYSSRGILPSKLACSGPFSIHPQTLGHLQPPPQGPACNHTSILTWLKVIFPSPSGLSSTMARLAFLTRPVSLVPASL